MEKGLKEEFKSMCNENPKDACLFALTAAMLKNVRMDQRDMYSDIMDVLYNDDITFTSPTIVRLKQVLSTYQDYENQVLDNMKFVEYEIARLLKAKFDGGKKPQCCVKKDLKVENQRANIKKWWE